MKINEGPWENTFEVYSREVSTLLSNPDESWIQALWGVKEAYRYYVDAHDNELRDAGITRADALRTARDLDAALPDGLRNDGEGTWGEKYAPWVVQP